MTLFNCVRKTTYVCGMDYLESKSKVESKVLRLERVAIADTTIASLSGAVFGIDSVLNEVTIDTATYALVTLTDKVTGKVYAALADSVGKYWMHFPAARYNLRVQSIAYNTLIVQDVVVGTDDIIKFDALLGASGTITDSSVFVMQADKTFLRVNVPAEIKK